VAKPEIVRRIKAYSAANGLVYQYQFHEIREETREGQPCAAYIYYATSDRKQMHALRVVVMRRALQKWSEANARTLTGTEEYAVAKMRLFEGFDEDDYLLLAARDLIVDEENIAALLEKLNL
jgi:hypothetical protein